MVISNKVSLVLIGIIGFVVLYAAWPKHPLLSEYELESEEFTRFLSTYSKSYQNSDLQNRFQIFTDNIRTIRRFNTFTSDFKLAANKFADLSPAEFKEMFTQPIEKPLGIKSTQLNSVSINPVAFDWRDEGAVTDVMNQGPVCKSSWAIAVVGAIEGARVAQALLPLEDLSVQQILDCVTNAGDHGCAGGLVDDAYTYVQTNALTSDVNYPYTGLNGTCVPPLANQTITNITKFIDVISQDSSTLITALASQPVAAAVEANNYVWQFYYSGVITGFCGSDIDHYVLLVGYNQTASTPYYTAKNSWGQDWGESGYVRIMIFGGSGICGVQTLPSYPIVT